MCVKTSVGWFGNDSPANRFSAQLQRNMTSTHAHFTAVLLMAVSVVLQDNRSSSLQCAEDADGDELHTFR